MKLTFTCGLPGSGKTTKAEQYASEHDVALIKLDDYTYHYREGFLPKDILSFAYADIISALNAGKNVLYDSVNPTKAERKHLIESLPSGTEIECLYMNTPFEQCAIRGKKMWTEIFARNFETPISDEGFTVIECFDGIDQTA